MPSSGQTCAQLKSEDGQFFTTANVCTSMSCYVCIYFISTVFLQETQGMNQIYLYVIILFACICRLLY